MSEISTASEAWEFWIDRGGTFTDVVAAAPDGRIVSAKLLSENPGQYADAAIEGIRRILGTAGDAELPVSRIAAVKMGTTVATNALLERRGERTLFLTTSGFADVLRIGYQNRPEIFALDIRLPEMLYKRVAEVPERVGADGQIVTPLDEAEVRRALNAAYEDGIRSCAIVFLHGYRYPAHEERAAAIARDVGFTQVSVSHQASPLIKMVGRGDTTVADAYLSPILRRYVDRVAAALPETRLMFMKSDGGLTDARLFQGKDALLSGPAGGIVAAARTGEIAGYDRIIGFDMGGTSTDVCHFRGEFERSYETVIAGVRIRVPMMRIHTVAAGGGSILHFDGTRYRVGPDSAGAAPGPASYRQGGPLTVTDCNVMLGKIVPDFFPHVFGPQGDAPLDAVVVRDKFAALARRIAADTGDERGAEEVAAGFLEIAVQNMANAIKKISVQRGHDVTGYTLNCFGGAGGQHACLVADALGIKRVLVHPLAGVLSAYGMGLADVTTHREHAVDAELTPGLVESLEAVFAELAADGTAELAQQGVAGTAVAAHRRVHLKYRGSDTTLEIPFGGAEEMRESFEDRHRAQFGFTDPDSPLVVEAVAVSVVGGAASRGDEPDYPLTEDGMPEPADIRPVFMDGARRETPFHHLRDLGPGMAVLGPAIIIEDLSTIVVEPGWQARLSAKRHLILERVAASGGDDIGTTVDPVMLEVFNNLFMSVAEQMGVTLQNTARSVNVKERMDFSCAVFDPTGALVANAPHVPVHLGSMGESVRAIIERRRETMRPGDVFMLNDPYEGGTHLPDITIITPIFDRAGAEILFFVASRAHHADIGGLTPGSMPPMSRRIEEEGVLITNFQLVAEGRLLEREVRELFAAAQYPPRNVDQNIADLKAQIAANEKGRGELLGMVAQYGLAVVHAYMGHVQSNAADEVRRVLDVLEDGAFADTMDDGGTIRVAVRLDRQGRRAEIDFTGTSDERDSNFNAPKAVTRAAVLYVLRSLVGSDIPLNDGCLEPISLIVPERSMLDPRYPAAVVAGNVEVSQVVTDVLLAALGRLAASQGTMNNITFGNDRYQHYETLCGGAGAGDGFDGSSAVHTHMTNSRLTDPEVLETRFPVRLLSFARRQGSGGAGYWHGGDGVVRRIAFLEPMTAGILANRYRTAPFGLKGGKAGVSGRAWVERVDGSRQILGGVDHVTVDTDDILVIETPGGGGYGPPEPQRDEEAS